MGDHLFVPDPAELGLNFMTSPSVCRNPFESSCNWAIQALFAYFFQLPEKTKTPQTLATSEFLVARLLILDICNMHS
jgi:hypothetical protein